MSVKLFSEKEDNILKNLYSTHTNKELVKVFNGTYSIKQIKNRGKDLGLKKDLVTKARAQKTRTGIWKDWEIEIIKKHFTLGGAETCHEYLERTIPSIKNKAYRLNIHMKNPNHANGPKKHSEESKRKMSKSKKGVKFSKTHLENIRKSAHNGENHHNWKGGRSFKEYGKEFNHKLKQQVKGRDKFTCQSCKRKHSWQRLVVHHIDYNKTNNSIENLITLCINCHNKHHWKLNEKRKKRRTKANF